MGPQPVAPVAPVALLKAGSCWGGIGPVVVMALGNPRLTPAEVEQA